MRRYYTLFTRLTGQRVFREKYPLYREILVFFYSISGKKVPCELIFRRLPVICRRFSHKKMLCYNFFFVTVEKTIIKFGKRRNFLTRKKRKNFEKVRRAILFGNITFKNKKLSRYIFFNKARRTEKVTVAPGC